MNCNARTTPIASADQNMQGESGVRANRVVMSSAGPPSVLRYEPYDVAAPAPGEVLIRQTAIGLNYIDIQHRTGRYPLPRYPSPIGMEGAGVVEAVGDEVGAFNPAIGSSIPRCRSAPMPICA